MIACGCAASRTINGLAVDQCVRMCWLDRLAVDEGMRVCRIHGLAVDECLATSQRVHEPFTLLEHWCGS